LCASVQDVDAAKVRAKAIKGLGSAVDADMRMLGFEQVQAGVEAALRDDSVSVREAAVDLIGKYISR
jgi:cohesin loading factor subunit SCC2